MDNSILANLQFEERRGAVFFKQVRYLLIRPETLIAFQRAAEERLGSKADELLYAGGFTGGTLSGKKYREVFGLTAAQSVEFMAKMGTELGWGKIRISCLDVSHRELVVEVEDSPFAMAYGPATRGTCHLIRGVFAGLAEVVFGCGVQASENECLALDNRRCLFAIRGG